jgi:hypothetical protein
MPTPVLRKFQKRLGSLSQALWRFKTHSTSNKFKLGGISVQDVISQLLGGLTMQRLFLAFLTVWMLSGFGASAQVPGVIPFQGYLTNAQGSPVIAPDGVVVEFRVFSGDGRLVFSDVDTVIVVDGILNTDIGDEGNPIPSDKLDPQSYVQVSVNGQQLEGKIPLGAAPFALVSGQASNSGGWSGDPVNKTTTTGDNVIIDLSDPNNSNTGLLVDQTGTGSAANFFVSNSGTTSPVVAGSTSSNTGAGIFGGIPNTGNINAALYGRHDGANGFGIYGVNSATNGIAARFDGTVQVNGTLTKTAGSFRIDHPLDPANKYLQHSFVESPDMMNVYNGNVVLDGNGEAVIQLPDWFGALNKDFRYQLTCIGGFAPVYIAEQIQNNRFKIAGGSSGLEISWQVTGIRQDAYARRHPIEVEVEKTGRERGRYLHPNVFGMPASLGIEYELQQYGDKQMKALQK